MTDLQQFLQHLDDINSDPEKGGIPVILGSSVRMVRNFKAYPFPENASEEERSDINRFFVENYSKKLEKSFKSSISLKNAPTDEMKILKNFGILAGDPSVSQGGRKIFCDYSSNLYIILNDRDHVSIVGYSRGLNLSSLYREINKVNTELDRGRSAFSEKLGYFTKDVQSAGTGLILRVFLHIPALTLNKKISSLSETLRHIGFRLEPILDSAEIECPVYIITDLRTLGVKEKSEVSRMEQVIQTVIVSEINERNILLDENRNRVIDMISKSYGVLSYSRRLSVLENLNLISWIRWGIDDGMFNKALYNEIDKLFFSAEYKLERKSAIQKEDDLIIRAKKMREIMKTYPFV